jgi:predicted dehydrogenase
VERKLKIGVFGGARGYSMISILLHHPDAELVAVCDKYEPLLTKAKDAAEKAGLNIACYTTFDDFLKHDMDAVVLANYANEHAPYAITCMKAGKHVLSEVLPCETMAQAVELIEAVESTGMVYAYAENYCYMKHAFEMWQRYQRGDIGEVMYGEGEYIHDCSSIWPRITYGERNHWRNRMHANFYCTHSLGPLLTATGLRPVKVVGFETVLPQNMLELGAYRGTGIELVTLENGAVLKSIHGDLKREPGSINYQLYGQKGMMESGRLEGDKLLNVYIEGKRALQGRVGALRPRKHNSL